MKVLVIGANGFIGRSVTEALRTDHEVITSAYGDVDGLRIDLSEPDSIAAALQDVHPDAIVNCAGVVTKDGSAAANPTFTKNLLAQVVASKLPIRRIVIMGSAAEYGLVDSLPVSEDAPRNATSPYGVGKVQEVDAALDFRNNAHLPVVVARLFNPLGEGMSEGMFVPLILRQIAAVRSGQSDHIEVRRLDGARDYIDIRDIGRAISVLVGGEPKYDVYNIGSGVSTPNRDLVNMVLAQSGLTETPEIIETSDIPEPQFATQADISRLQEEFGWRPQYSVADTVKRLINAA